MAQVMLRLACLLFYIIFSSQSKCRVEYAPDQIWPKVCGEGSVPFGLCSRQMLLFATEHIAQERLRTNNIIKTSVLKPRYCSGVQYVLRWLTVLKHGDNTNTCRCVLASLSLRLLSTASRSSVERWKVTCAASTDKSWETLCQRCVAMYGRSHPLLSVRATALVYVTAICLKRANNKPASLSLERF